MLESYNFDRRVIYLRVTQRKKSNEAQTAGGHCNICSDSQRPAAATLSRLQSFTWLLLHSRALGVLNLQALVNRLCIDD